jgi:hypothetical protein
MDDLHEITAPRAEAISAAIWDASPGTEHYLLTQVLLTKIVRTVLEKSRHEFGMTYQEMAESFVKVL